MLFHKRKSLKPLKVQEQLLPHTLMPEEPLSSLTVDKRAYKKAHLEKFLNAMSKYFLPSQQHTKIK